MSFAMFCLISSVFDILIISEPNAKTTAPSITAKNASIYTSSLTEKGNLV